MLSKVKQKQKWASLKGSVNARVMLALSHPLLLVLFINMDISIDKKCVMYVNKQIKHHNTTQHNTTQHKIKLNKNKLIYNNNNNNN